VEKTSYSLTPGWVAVVGFCCFAFGIMVTVVAYTLRMTAAASTAAAAAVRRSGGGGGGGGETDTDYSLLQRADDGAL
jgi:hypothetical protein